MQINRPDDLSVHTYMVYAPYFLDPYVKKEDLVFTFNICKAD